MSHRKRESLPLRNSSWAYTLYRCLPTESRASSLSLSLSVSLSLYVCVYVSTGIHAHYKLVECIAWAYTYTMSRESCVVSDETLTLHTYRSGTFSSIFVDFFLYYAYASFLMIELLQSMLCFQDWILLLRFRIWRYFFSLLINLSVWFNDCEVPVLLKELRGNIKSNELIFPGGSCLGTSRVWAVVSRRSWEREEVKTSS